MCTYEGGGSRVAYFSFCSKENLGFHSSISNHLPISRPPSSFSRSFPLSSPSSFPLSSPSSFPFSSPSSFPPSFPPSSPFSSSPAAPPPAQPATPLPAGWVTSLPSMVLSPQGLPGLFSLIPTSLSLDRTQVRLCEGVLCVKECCV